MERTWYIYILQNEILANGCNVGNAQKLAFGQTLLEVGAASCELAVAEYLWNHNETPQQHQPPQSSTTTPTAFSPLGIGDEVILTALDELEIARKQLEHRTAQTVLFQAMLCGRRARSNWISL